MKAFTGLILLALVSSTAGEDKEEMQRARSEVRKMKSSLLAAGDLLSAAVVLFALCSRS